MNPISQFMRTTGIVMLTLLIAGCDATQSKGGAEATATAASGAAQKTAVLQLGKAICGDCCYERVSKAFAHHPGIGRLTMSPGDIDFLVEYDPAQTSPATRAAILADAGETGARVSPNSVRNKPDKLWVVAR